MQTQYVLAEPISEPRAQRDDYCRKFRNHGAKDIVQHHLSPTNSIGAQLAILLALSFASIFRLAARIISSLRFCRAVCRSCLLADHPCFELVSSCEDVSEIFTFEERLYLLIKSIGAVGAFVTGLVCPLWAGVPIGIGGCGWNEGGGYRRYCVSRNSCQRSIWGGGVLQETRNVPDASGSGGDKPGPNPSHPIPFLWSLQYFLHFFEGPT